MMKRGHYIVIVGVIALGMSGCAGMSGDFKCNKTAGDSCQSIASVNKQASAGTLSASSSSMKKKVAVPTPSNPVRGGYAVATPQAGERVRGGEIIQRIWLAPYQDIGGNYHEPAFVYAVISPSRWIGPPPIAVKQSDEGVGE